MATTTAHTSRSLERRILQREILKYGGPLVSDIEREHEDSIGCSNLTPQLATDATLTGFAQLAALRMKSKHAFISLIDEKFQHVLAEATRTVSPFDLSIHEPDDDLAVGVQTLDLEFGICPITLAAFSKGSDHWIDTEITYADEQKYVISDLLAEPRVNQAGFMEGNTTSRFYAEVPLRNSQGMIIGSVSVIDDAPRTNPAAIDVRALEDVALMTMDHFELIRIKEVSQRAERLMQGLGHFNLGKSSISRWIMNNSAQPATTNGQPYGVETDSPFLTPHFIEETPTPGVGVPDNSHAMVTPSLTMERSGYFDSQPTKLTPPTLKHNKPPIPRSNGTNGAQPVQDITSRRSEIAQSRVPTNIRDAFERASNLIRESMDLDATCFLELSPGAHLNTRARKASTTSLNPSSPLSSPPHSTRPEAHSVRSRQGVPQSRTHVSTKKLCSRLGFSSQTGLKESELADNIEFATFPETSLCKLAYEYSAGSIFNFDSLGALSTDDETRNDAKCLQRRRKLANLMIRHFPNARNLIFMPLYDNETRHLYAGFFGWTTDPRRVLLDSEVVYVLGFANSIMCEVMRLETLAVEKAKTDFMSSMSHELRSPLHGILGATQLLQESELPSTQRELATMIDSCGRTLLDIMNNLLEHAKITNITNAKRVNIRQGKDSTIDGAKKDAAHDGTLELINLASLVEETVTSVAAGHSVRQQRTEQVSTRRPSNRSVDLENLSEGDIDAAGLPLPPAVIINIPYEDSWQFESEAGSWRRVVMNLVGNALKYTQRGHISVSLKSTPVIITKIGKEGGVVLTVEDTGQGISESYLKNRLYTPFAQEDNLSSGAGLGLSIVNRLVEALGGTIEIESEVDVGTKVTVHVPIAAIRRDHATFTKSNSMIGFDTVRRLIDDKSEAFAVVGFDNSAKSTKNTANSDRRQAQTLLALQESLVNSVSTWFGLVQTETPEQASIVMIEDSFARNLLGMDPSNAIFKKKFIVVNAQDSAAPKTQNWPGCCSFLAAPIGPVKLNRVLSSALQQDPSIERVDMVKRRHSATKSPKPTNETSSPTSGPPLKKPKLNLCSLDKTNCRVLLVEDNAINLKLLASFVRKLGFPYTTATNGQEALDEYTASFEEGNLIRYVLMDITMPVMDGISATRHIRAFEKSKHVDPAAEIIALTGLGHVEAQTEAMASGVDQYFCKPVKLDQLRKLLTDE